MSWTEMSYGMRPEIGERYRGIIADADREVTEANRHIALNWVPILTVGRKGAALNGLFDASARCQ